GAGGRGRPPRVTAAADEVTGGESADGTQRRRVLAAVLTVPPALGPVTVQARKTIVSLVSPRRTFAVVQATTRTRVDLGLRLENTAPGGRLQVARNMGGATVRIALAGPGDVDGEGRDWMRRACEESTARPAPRGPARRRGPVVGTMTVAIEGSELPGRTCRPEPDGLGHENVHVALGGHSADRTSLTMSNKPGMAIEPVPGDA